MKLRYMLSLKIAGILIAGKVFSAEPAKKKETEKAITRPTDKPAATANISVEEIVKKANHVAYYQVSVRADNSNPIACSAASLTTPEATKSKAAIRSACNQRSPSSAAGIFVRILP